MRSFAAVALCLAFVHISHARVPHSFHESVQRDAEVEPQPGEVVLEWLRRLLKRDLMPRQDATCYEDEYYTFVGSPALGERFCQDYMNYPNRTVPIEATATSTLTTTYTTDVDAITEYTRVTPSSTLIETVTAEGGAKVRRDGEARITARAVLNRDEAFQLYRRQTNNTDNDNVMASAFSSACSCHDYEGPVISETYTGQTSVRTLSAFANVQTTVTQTRTDDPTIVSTTTTTVPTTPPTTTPPGSQAEAPSPTDGGPSPINPTPTAPAFSCPEDHNTTRSQLVGNEKFAYLVLCDTILMDADIYNGVLSYRSFEECVGACSVADQQFDGAVCQGVSFYATDDSGEGNCFLKGAANNTVPSPGVDSALLQNIAVGYDNETAAASSTESLPFANVQATADPVQMNSMMAAMFANSTDNMPMVTPGQPAVQSGRQVAAITAYSTYISDGSTFSTGTGYSFSTSYSNGSWYYAYYTSYTKTWASATTIYGASETGYVVENSTDTNSYQTSGENGQYGIVTWSNTTYSNGSAQDVVQTISYEANGTPFYSTATTYYTAATGVSGGGGGGSGSSVPASTPAGPLITPTAITNNGSSSGGNEGAGAGGPGNGGPSSPITLTSTSLTQTVIYNPGGTGGASGAVGSGGPPVTFTGVSTIIRNGSTAYETFLIVSGGPAGTGSVGSGQGSGGPTSAPTLTPISIISTSGATGGESGFQAFGGSDNTAGASSLIGSGGPSPSPSSSPSTPASLSIVSVVSNSGATGGGFSGFSSGGPGATGGGSSLILSGGPSPSSSTSVSFSGNPREGTYSTTTTTTVNVTAPVGPSGTSPTASFTGVPRSGEYDTSPSTAPGTAPGPSSSPTASFTGLPRSGDHDTPPGTAPGTAPAPSSSPSASFTGVPRSGDYSSSPSSAPLFTAPSGGVYSPPSFVAPSGTSPGTYSGTGAPPSGDYSSSSGTVPIFTAPSGGVYSPPSGVTPSGTSPGTYSGTGLPRSGDYSSSPPGTAPTAPSGYLAVPSGTVPSGSAPSGTAPRPSSSAPSGTAPLPSESTPEESETPDEQPPPGAGYRGQPPPGTAPTSSGTGFSTGTGLSGYLPPTGTSPLTFSNTDVPRVPGTGSPSGTMPLSTHAYPSMALPTVHTSCANMTQGTTTIFSTTTVFGCYSTCLPLETGFGGYGGGPQPFGPGGGGGATGPPGPEEPDSDSDD